MPEDRLRTLFEKLARARVDIGPAAAVVARGRRRRRRTRSQLSACAVVIVVAAGFGARQLAGSTGAAKGPSGPAASTSHPAPAGQVIPPAGTGSLILGLDYRNQFVMTRVSSATPPVPVPGLTAIVGGPSLVTTNAAGGWVVTYSTDPGAPPGAQPARLAVVTQTGEREPFGPVFRRDSIASVAVSPDGDRAAVALLGQSGSTASIEVLPMPGQPGRARIWRLPPTQANSAESLSWEPDGRHLTYIAGALPGGGGGDAPETLDTAAPGTVAPASSLAWQAAVQRGAGCIPDLVAWLGTSGRFVALEECARTAKEILQPADIRNGAAAGPAIIVGQAGCGPPTLTWSLAGGRLLTSVCGSFFLDDHGQLYKQKNFLEIGALAG